MSDEQPSEHNAKTGPTAVPPPGEVAPGPNTPAEQFKRNLGNFLEQLDSLTDALSFSMKALHFAGRDSHKRLADFSKEYGTPVDGEPDTFAIPFDHLGTFEKLLKRAKRQQRASRIAPRIHLVALVSEFDAFLGALLRLLYTLRSDLLDASGRTFTFAQLQAFGSIDAARDHLLEKEVESFLRQSHSEQFDTLEKKFGLKLRVDLAIWPIYVELTERRNLFVHNSGVVTQHYLDVCHTTRHDTDAKRGDELECPPDYWRRAHEALYELAVKLTQVFWRKLDPGSVAEADAHLAGTVVFDLLVSGRYELAQAVADFGATTARFKSDYYRRVLAVNRAQAYIWNGKRKEGFAILDAEDWTASKDVFELCVSAVRGDVDRCLALMKKVGTGDEVGKRGYREWPAFRDMRKKTEFQALFQEVFGEPLAVIKRTAEADAQPAQDGSSSSDAEAGVVH